MIDRMESFKQSVLDDFDYEIEVRKEQIKEYKEQIQYLNAQVKKFNNGIEDIEKAKKSIDDKIAVVNEEVAWLQDNGFARLDGRVAKAIVHRNLSTVMNLKKRPTKIVAYNTFVTCEDQYWCKAWFSDVVGSIPTRNRQQFYETLEELKDDHEELQKQVGIWLLNSVA